MAKLWGTTSGDEQKPNWLTAEEKEATFAGPGGWTLRHPNGTEEVLVALARLQTRIGAPTIVSVAFGNGTFTAGASRTVKVSYNEKVTVTGNPTLVVAGTVTPSTTATYASSNAAGTTLTFSFIVPAAGQTLSIGSQSVSLSGGTIVDQTGGASAELVVTAGQGTDAGTKTTV